MSEILLRLCWNDSGWQRPANTCRHEGGFPNYCGFGHEEWNFRKDQAIDGYIYGHMGPIPERISKTGNPFKIGFWAYDKDTKKKLLAGLYLEAEPSGLDDPQTCDYIDKEFQRRGIYDSRADELFGISTYYTNKMCLGQRKRKIKQTHYTHEDAYKIVRDSVLEGEVRIKCKQEKVILFDEFIELPDEIWSSITNTMKPLHLYFYKPYYIEDQDFLETLLKNGVQPSGLKPSTTKRRPASKSKPSGKRIISIQEKYPRVSPKTERIIEPLHSKLVFEFATWLKKEFTIITKAEKGYIDLQFSHRGVTYMVEAKIIYGTSPKYGIREALGQIFEYNFYDSYIEKERWIILINKPPEPEDILYVETLVKRWGFPLILSWKDGKAFQFNKDTKRELQSSS